MNNDQNGRQTFVSQDLRSSAPATESRTRNASLTSHEQNNISICRDFIWGICTKGSRCAFRHVRDMECMKTILKFCHDFQNKTGCLRPDCTYLHTSREEQSAFLNSGQIPKVLTERYAAMSSGLPSSGNVYGGEAHTPRGPVTTYPTHPTLPRALRAVMPPLLVPPPPPPPPPVPVTTPPVQPGPSTYAAPIQLKVSPMLQMKHQITSLPPKFDATKPPPPLPQSSTISRKRLAVSPEAGPSKARKMGEQDTIDNLCDNCVHRQIRVELLRQDLQNYQTDKDYKTEVYTKKCEDYEHGKLLMRSIVNADLYHFLEDYIEQDSSTGAHNQEQSQFTQTSSLATSLSTSSIPFMRQLLERVFDKGTRNMLEPHPIPPPVNYLDNSILKSLTSFARSRVTPVKMSTAEVFQTLVDLMCERNVPDTTNEGNESRTNDMLNLGSLPSSSSFSSVMTGFTQLIKSQKPKSPSPEVKSSTLPAQLGGPSTSYGSPSVAVRNTLMSSPPLNFVQFRPNMPPPTRPMFSASLTSTPGSVPINNPYNPNIRMGASPTMPTRPAIGSASPPRQPGQNVVRYPGSFPMPPNYYPPYQ